MRAAAYLLAVVFSVSSAFAVHAETQSEADARWKVKRECAAAAATLSLLLGADDKRASYYGNGAIQLLKQIEAEARDKGYSAARIKDVSSIPVSEMKKYSNESTSVDDRSRLMMNTIQGCKARGLL